MIHHLFRFFSCPGGIKVSTGKVPVRGGSCAGGSSRLKRFRIKKAMPAQTRTDIAGKGVDKGQFEASPVTHAVLLRVAVFAGGVAGADRG